MRTLLLSFVCAATGCATTSTSTRVVDVQGRSVNSTARLDALGAEATLHCGADRYVVVPREQPFLMGTYVGMRTANTHPAALCERIRRD